jgi:hypothetical protein
MPYATEKMIKTNIPNPLEPSLTRNENAFMGIEIIKIISPIKNSSRKYFQRVFHP